MIFDWFAEDFEADAKTIQRYLGKYVEDPAIALALGDDAFELGYLEYDWSLNGIRPQIEPPKEEDSMRANDR